MKQFVRLMDKVGNIVGSLELTAEQAVPDVVRIGAQEYVATGSSVIEPDGSRHNEYIESIVLVLESGTFGAVEMVK